MTKRIFLSLITSALLHIPMYGQDNATTLAYQGNMQVINLSTYGLLISNASHEKVIVSRLDEEGDMMWKSELALTYNTKKMNRLLFGNKATQNTHFLVTSASGKNAFLVEASADLFSNSSEVKVTHFDTTGSANSFEFENLHHEMGSSFHATFCDDQYLYFLARGKEKRDRQLSHEERFILNRFDIQTFEYRKIILEIPDTYSNKFSKSTWTFIGQFEGQKYLVNKFADLQENKVVAKVVTFNEYGEFTDTINLSYSPKSGFIRPSHHIQLRDRNIALHESPDYQISS